MGRNKKKDCDGWVQIYNQLKELFMSSFKWENLPSTVNQRFLELMLFDEGKCVFFKDEEIGHLALRGILNGQIDLYGEYTKIRAFASNGYQNDKLVNHKNSVMIFNNYVRDSPHIRIKQFAERIWKIEKTIDLNIHQQKTNKIMKTSKKTELTVKNMLMQIDEFNPAVFVDKDLDVGGTIVYDLSTPYITDKLEEQKRKLWNEALSFIGIENNFSEKNERLTAGEVLVSNGLAIANRNAKLQARQKAVEEINGIFNLNIEVKNNHLSVLDFEENGGGENFE